jgi:hypothetical protein
MGKRGKLIRTPSAYDAEGNLLASSTTSSSSSSKNKNKNNNKRRAAGGKPMSDAERQLVLAALGINSGVMLRAPKCKGGDRKLPVRTSCVCVCVCVVCVVCVLRGV